MSTVRFFAGVLIFGTILMSCGPDKSHREMVQLLDEQRKNYNRLDNYYASGVQVDYYDSLINATNSAQDKMFLTYNKCYALIASGREAEAIPILEEQVNRIIQEGIQGMDRLKVQLALAYLRLGERTNCIANHTDETCIMPIQGSGIHKVQDGSRKAIGIYKALLATYPENMEYRWLLNVAYMTLGEYPSKVPPAFLIPGLAAVRDSTVEIQPFRDVASSTHLDINDMAGGIIVEDFDNDGYLDIVTSSWDLDVEMHFFKNSGDGTFVDKSAESRLKDLRGGLNLMQMDFNNDGWKDIFVLRGAWLRGSYGLQPNSLVRNNGDGTFTDITTSSGLLSFHPTQTATWNDFNNDGWVDVFIGNETWEGNKASGEHPCELYLNNHDGTFSEVARKANANKVGF
ncbi:MAG TPA: VCBS repeat-containing protein, partial [Chryseolinea sp.]